MKTYKVELIAKVVVDGVKAENPAKAKNRVVDLMTACALRIRSKYFTITSIRAKEIK